MLKKKLAIVVFIELLLNTFTFAKSGAMSGEKNLKVAKTNWFDIIYPEKSELSAAILYENVDAIYEEIAEYYGEPIVYRMPVVITPAIEIDNAYFTTYPYNHIVVYDTAIIDDLNVFSETLLSTFKHELVHAYTFNMKNKVWKFIGKFYNPLTMGVLTVSPGMAEGATVSTESAKGEGRMNDEYSLHTIKQSIIEDDFPRYAEVRGSRDVYPYGGYYYFTGAFHKWLQDEYGMEKYAKYWYNCINKSITNNGAFLKAYKMTYKKAWSKFEKNFPVPDVHANPVEAGEVKDFFVADGRSYSTDNNSGSRYTKMFMAENGLFFVDGSNSTIYFVDKTQLSDSKIKPKKLCQITSLYDLTVSPDGKYFIVTIDDENTATSKLRNILYSYDGKSTKKLYTFKETGYFDCSILQNNGNYYLFANQYDASIYSVVAKKLNINGKYVEPGSNLFEKKLPVYKYASDFIQCGAERFAFIRKDGMNFSICISDFDGNILQEFASPEERLTIRDLSYNQSKNKILFSWVKKGTMPRTGFLNLNENTFDLCKTDISGGVFAPYSYEDDLIYVGKFYKENRIFVKSDFEKEWTYDRSAAEIKSDDLAEKWIDNGNKDELVNSILNSSNLSAVSKNYNQLDFYKMGCLIPFPQLSVNSKTTDGTPNSLLLGAEWLTSNPWDTDSLQIDFGTNIFDVTALRVAYSSGTDTSAFKYGIASQTEFDWKGWRYSNITGNINASRSFDKIHGNAYLGTEESYGHYSDYVTNEKITTHANYLYSYNEAGIYLSDISKGTSGKYGWKGVGFEGRLYNQYISRDDGEEILDDYDVMLRAVGYIPQLLPWKNKVGVVTNLPLRIELSLFPPAGKNPELADRNNEFLPTVMIPSYALQLDTELVLYGMDLQCSFDFIPILYFNEFRISFVTKGGLEMPVELENQSMKIMSLSNYPDYIRNGDSKFSTLLGFKAELEYGPNFGNLCRSSRSYLCAQLDFLPVNRERPATIFHLYTGAEF